jgi:hypothetical protein
MELVIEDKHFFSEQTSEIDSRTVTYIRDSIENMSKFNQIEVLKILNDNKDKDNGVTINENKYGIHINLSDLSNDLLTQLLQFVTYVTEQEKDLNKIEKQKEIYKNNYFGKDIKDNKLYNK